MSAASEPAYGMIALLAAALAFVAALIVRVKVRALSARGFGVRVYDIGAHLDFPPALHSRGYRFALYLTMKSLPREPV